MTKDDADYVLSVIQTDGFDYTFEHKSSFNDIKDCKFHEIRTAYLNCKVEMLKYLNSIVRN